MATGRRIPQSTKDEIRSLWRARSYDTMQLAERFDLPESAIYGVISCRVAVAPVEQKSTPKANKAAFCGAPGALPMVRQTGFAKPVPPYAGYDPTERQFR